MCFPGYWKRICECFLLGEAGRGPTTAWEQSSVLRCTWMSSFAMLLFPFSYHRLEDFKSQVLFSSQHEQKVQHHVLMPCMCSLNSLSRLQQPLWCRSYLQTRKRQTLLLQALQNPAISVGQPNFYGLSLVYSSVKFKLKWKWDWVKLWSESHPAEDNELHAGMNPHRKRLEKILDWHQVNIPDCADKASMSLGWQLSQRFFFQFILTLPHYLVVVHCNSTVNYLNTRFSRGYLAYSLSAFPYSKALFLMSMKDFL